MAKPCLHEDSKACLAGLDVFPIACFYNTKHFVFYYVFMPFSSYPLYLLFFQL